MKAFLCLFLVAFARAAPVDEVVATELPVEEVRVEKNSQDASILLSEPIDKTTKLILELDEQIRKYLPAEDESLTTIVPAIIYSGDVISEPAEVDPVSQQERQNQMQSLIDQVNRLAESIENTITDLVSRRRYVTAAMLRSMLNYVRRVRVNLERLQNRLQSVQAVATVQGQQAPPVGSGTNQPSNVPGAQFFNTIRDRVNRITEEIGALVSRIRGSFTPGIPTPSNPNGPLPPLEAGGLPPAGVSNGGGLIASFPGSPIINSVGTGVAVDANAVANAIVAGQ
jgi:ribosomal protein S15P/S13E